MGDFLGDLQRTSEAIGKVRNEGGWGQLYVSLRQDVVADVAWGTSPGGVEMSPEFLVPWASAVKPTTNMLVMQAWERGELAPDDRVADHIAGFEVGEKDDVTLRHLLTHTGHLGGYRGPMNLGTWDDTIDKIVKSPRVGPSPLRPGASRVRAARGVARAAATYPPAPLPLLGTTSSYNPAGTWILAEIVRRLDERGRDFGQIVREEVYEPCGMHDSWNGIPPDRFEGYGSRLAVLNATAETASKSQPAGGGVGPSRDLGRFYEVMLAGGSLGDRQLVSPQTVEAMTTPKSVAGTMGIWGFGFNLNASKVYAPEPPTASEEDRAAEEASQTFGVGRRRFGSHSSWRTFGHGGATGMQAFADPEHELVIAAIGRVPVADAVYEDLGLAP